ncbi:ThuA domain-containing protein [Croceicoccus ponticola]|uniref:ThuA domain-containing protein n=1 Tax=Croceicoccus ponticola TaxID=2217664 RepID=A0A437GZ92_9SPHN|nr:ThuA domain-containing protein [Croceicoccus ponticola]RVQ68674.1 ThuA domain-containing protein [Croceicoccus ponticola]
MSRPLKLFCAVKGHAFDRNAFEDMFRACGAEPTIVDQPAASAMIEADLLGDYDAIALHDMWGLDFRAPRDERPASVEPSDALKAGWQTILSRGTGVLAIHHAIAAWPAWDDYARMLGGRFLYRDGMLDGAMRQDSGYCPDVFYRARTEPHAVTRGVADEIDFLDELYAMEVLDSEGLEPILTRVTDIEPGRFISAKKAVRRIEGGPDWSPSSDNRLLGWAKTAGHSRVVYLQPGDGPQTFAHGEYRALITNALRWIVRKDAA